MGADYRQQQELEEERYQYLIQILGRVALGTSTVDDALELGRELGLRRPLHLVSATREAQEDALASYNGQMFDRLMGKVVWNKPLQNLGVDGKDG